MLEAGAHLQAKRAVARAHTIQQGEVEGRRLREVRGEGYGGCDSGGCESHDGRSEEHGELESHGFRFVFLGGGGGGPFSQKLR